MPLVPARPVTSDECLRRIDICQKGTSRVARLRSCQRQVVQQRTIPAAEQSIGVINALEQGTADATALERIMQLQYDTRDALEMAYDFLGGDIKKRKAKPLYGEHQMQPTLTGSDAATTTQSDTRMSGNNEMDTF